MKKKGVLITAISLIIGVIVCGVAAGVIWSQNRGLTKIDNFEEYYYGVPEQTQRAIYSALYSTISVNSPNYVPLSGAVIRDTEPYTYNYNAKNNGYNGKFVVDIPEIQQSYLVKISFSGDPNEPFGGYAALVYCLDTEQMIYPDFSCKQSLPFYDSNTDEGDNGDV